MSRGMPTSRKLGSPSSWPGVIRFGVGQARLAACRGRFRGAFSNAAFMSRPPFAWVRARFGREPVHREGLRPSRNERPPVTLRGWKTRRLWSYHVDSVRRIHRTAEEGFQFQRQREQKPTPGISRLRWPVICHDEVQAIDCGQGQ